MVGSSLNEVGEMSRSEEGIRSQKRRTLKIQQRKCAKSSTKAILFPLKIRRHMW
jgi:hypothetical protein